MKTEFILTVFILVFFIAGCQSVSGPKSNLKTNDETQSALESIAGSMAGKDLSEDDLKKLKGQLQHDPQAREAVRTLTDTLSNPKGVVKYCPIDGKRYSEKFDICPVHHVKLKIVGE